MHLKKYWWIQSAPLNSDFVILWPLSLIDGLAWSVFHPFSWLQFFFCLLLYKSCGKCEWISLSTSYGSVTFSLPSYKSLHVLAPAVIIKERELYFFFNLFDWSFAAMLELFLLMRAWRGSMELQMWLNVHLCNQLSLSFLSLLLR